MSENEKESLSSRSLAGFLEERGVTAVAQLTGIHRTQLWKYAKGKSKPDADQIAKLHDVSEGRIAANGWGPLPAPPTVNDGPSDPTAKGAA